MADQLRASDQSRAVLAEGEDSRNSPTKAASVRAFIVQPLVSALFIDLLNPGPQAGLAGMEANRWRPRRSERKVAVSWPRTLLPAPSSRGE